jgi:CRISPR-associated endonuclease/helicase Cas3
MQYYAHTLENAPPENWQLLTDHLGQVSTLAGEFAGAFGCEEWARVAGSLHDIGKYHIGFQNYLHQANGLSFDCPAGADLRKPNHSGIGANIASEKYGIRGRILSYIISGHHAGLYDWTRMDTRLKGEKEKFSSAALPAPHQEILKSLPQGLSIPSFIANNPSAFHCWVRMLFSCLVDADFLDTEAFMGAQKSAGRIKYPPLSELLEKFDSGLDNLAHNAEDTEINRLRAEILAMCRNAADGSKGIRSLSVPTGGGKTLSGTAFALRHAVKHGMSRIIYVIPFTSIIEQTSEVLRGFLGNENVVEHHCNLDPENQSLSSKLAAENWGAPIIVTTNVQFFESFYAAKPSRCRKLHNLANSVIILDEVQKLPPEWLYPCVEMLNRLAQDYSASIVLSTATKPCFKDLTTPPVEIIDDPDRFSRTLCTRTQIDWPENINEQSSWDELAAEIITHKQAMCIVNTRRDCHQLWAILREQAPETIHLSAQMCGKHRMEVISEIKQRLAAGRGCLVICTQLVEAGVDLDFPVVYRAMAGLDSIAQAAGRCNREGSRQSGLVKVFIPPKSSPQGLLRKGEDASRELLELDGELNIFEQSTCSKFFELFYASVNSDGREKLEKNLVQNANPDLNVNFSTFAENFKLIDNSGAAVIIRYKDSSKLIEELKYVGPNRGLMRKLQRYTVNLPHHTFHKLMDERRIEEIYPNIYVQLDSALYREDIGLDVFSAAYKPEDLIL